MQINYSTSLINNFNQELKIQIESIEEKELKILLALSDILVNPKEEENDFINKSLIYLKDNYALNKSVWKVLLKLHDEVPNFAENLSHWQEPEYVGYSGKSRYSHFLITYPIDNYGIGENLREYNLKKLFNFIGLLCKNFGIEEATAYIGLFFKEFDTQKSPYSINNLYELSKKLIAEEKDERISWYSVNFFCEKFYLTNTIYYTLRKLHYMYIDQKFGKKLYKDYIPRSLEFVFEHMEIPYTSSLDTFKSIINSYKKYTFEEFITYKGLMEIKNKKILCEDSKNISYLLKELEKSQKYNDTQNQLCISLIKLVKKYEHDVIKGIDKRDILNDYIGRSTDYLKKVDDGEEINLKNLLAWSNNWHEKGESKGEKKEFKVYNINKKIGNYIFEQIIDNHQLHEEGKSQSHCVYSYQNDCLKQTTIIVSMKDTKGKRLSTIRLKKRKNIVFSLRKKTIWELVENRKKFNKACSIEEKRVAKEYFELIKNKLSNT